LSNVISGIDSEIISLSADVLAQINVGIEAAKHLKTKEQFKGVTSSHSEFVASHIELLDLTERLRAFYNQDNLEIKILSFRKLLGETNHENLADEELLKNLTQSTDFILEVPNRLAFFVASAQIPAFTATIFFRDTLAAYLSRPTIFGSVLEKSWTLVEAALKDVAGIIFPVVSTVEALANISTPRLLRELEKMEDAVGTLDKVHLLQERLSELCLLERKAKSDLEISITEAASLSAKFEFETEWINSVLAAARDK
jgi:hypothetical protein